MDSVSDWKGLKAYLDLENISLGPETSINHFENTTLKSILKNRVTLKIKRTKDMINTKNVSVSFSGTIRTLSAIVIQECKTFLNNNGWQISV